jgi:hypothetical protein
MYEIIGFSKNLKKFAAGRTSEPDNRGEFFCLMQPVTFRKANNTVPRIGFPSLGLFKPIPPGELGPWHDEPG